MFNGAYLAMEREGLLLRVEAILKCWKVEGSAIHLKVEGMETQLKA